MGLYPNHSLFRKRGLILIFILHGCVVDGGQPMPDWNGLHEEALVELMGAPTERVSLPGGKMQLIYDQGRLDHHAGSHGSWTCRMYFTTDDRGFVEHVSSAGC